MSAICTSDIIATRNQQHTSSNTLHAPANDFSDHPFEAGGTVKFKHPAQYHNIPAGALELVCLCETDSSYFPFSLSGCIVLSVTSDKIKK